MITLKECQDLIEKEIKELKLIKEPVQLYEPIEYILSIGGKRIRPAMVLMASQLYSNDIKNALMPAMAVEMFHNFTLLHDDIMDEAEVRRGVPTVHKKWNENVGILSGDAMLIEAYKLVNATNTNNLRALFEVFNKTALEVCEGQQYDMDFEDRNDVLVDEYLKMIRLKTAVLLAASLKIGALCADAPESEADCLYEFGINLGFAFQLKDDYLDAFSDPQVFGKATGGDIVCNKKTYLLLRTLEKANGEDKAILNNWIAKKEFDRDDKIEAVKSLMLKYGVVDEIKDEIYKYSQTALGYISNISGDKNQLNELEDLVKKLVDREK